MNPIYMYTVNYKSIAIKLQGAFSLKYLCDCLLKQRKFQIPLLDLQSLDGRAIVCERPPLLYVWILCTRCKIYSATEKVRRQHSVMFFSSVSHVGDNLNRVLIIIIIKFPFVARRNISSATNAGGFTKQCYAMQVQLHTNRVCCSV